RVVVEIVTGIYLHRIGAKMNDEGRPLLSDATTTAHSYPWWWSGWFVTATVGGALCLLALVLLYMGMSFRKLVTAAKKAVLSAASDECGGEGQPLKKVRCTSMSVDMDSKNHITSSSGDTVTPRLQRSRSLDCRSMQNFGSKCDGDSAVHCTAKAVAAVAETQIKKHKTMLQPTMFPFQELPNDCQIKIFQFLCPADRGRLSRVCAKWAALMRTSCIWDKIDLTTFPSCPAGDDTDEQSYIHYRKSVKAYLHYLQEVRPTLHWLSFMFDIGNHEDGWLECLSCFLKKAHCRDLKFAHLDWTETPIRTMVESVTWSTNDYHELMHRHRHRQRLFVNFFTMFGAMAPNLRQLIVPFDWSQKSLVTLSRLHNLRTLVLEKYFVVQQLDQAMLDELFRAVPNVRCLILEVWTASGKGLQLYSLRSENLRELDISQCKGFYIRDIRLPNIEVLKMSRRPCYGPLVGTDGVRVPCIYEVLCEGTDRLRQLNEHVLRPDWRENIYNELNTVLRAVCSCHVHKSSLAT
ncbi:hypothetical protein LSAT2_031733, partial [Lamellibrachia satsuma]